MLAQSLTLKSVGVYTVPRFLLDGATYSTLMWSMECMECFDLNNVSTLFLVVVVNNALPFMLPDCIACNSYTCDKS